MLAIYRSTSFRSFDNPECFDSVEVLEDMLIVLDVSRSSKSRQSWKQF